MVRRDLVSAKTGRARAWLNDAAPLLLGPVDAFLADPKGRDLRARADPELVEGSGSSANTSGSALMATARPSFVSRARNTSPIPPLPSRETIS